MLPATVQDNTGVWCCETSTLIGTQSFQEQSQCFSFHLIILNNCNQTHSDNHLTILRSHSLLFSGCLVNLFLHLCYIPAMFDIAKVSNFLCVCLFLYSVLRAVPERQLITRAFVSGAEEHLRLLVP